MSDSQILDAVYVAELLKRLGSRYSSEIYSVENDATLVRADVLFKWLGFDSP